MPLPTASNLPQLLHRYCIIFPTLRDTIRAPSRVAALGQCRLVLLGCRGGCVRTRRVAVLVLSSPPVWRGFSCLPF
ncbi:hypothetical protein EIKCOROL_00289 [Eikenella corrodens ATCC 23834]|uniref:Uncharacterized protein n=1 Tax=Eikenella corrodens ATCC 23834 TaxID=546274 RepID=C0DSG7_EIKCO|nr:hypothetical protein EIKCOROL_00289 [Eikenella corrodens ATCC 23834]